MTPKEIDYNDPLQFLSTRWELRRLFNQYDGFIPPLDNEDAMLIVAIAHARGERIGVA